MTADDPKAVVRRFIEEVINNKDLSVIDELVAEDCVDHTPMPGQGPGREGVRQAMQMLTTAFPDTRFEVLAEAAEGDLVATVTRMTGTNEGEFMGMPATGRRVSVLASDMSRASGGRLVEHWGFFDQGAMMEQLGMSQGGAPPG